MIKTLAKTALLSPILLASPKSHAKFEDLFNESFFAPAFGSCGPQASASQKLTRTKEGFQFQIALPGFKRKDVQITLNEQNILVIHASRSTKKEDQKEKEGESVLFDSFSNQSITQNLPLGYDIDPKSIQAQMNDGILTISMTVDPKKSSKKVIEIK